MKKDIHPELHKGKFKCACGFESEALTTRGGDIELEICSQCHPFFTGKQRFVDTAGRIDRFRRKYAQFTEDNNKAAES